MFHLSVMRRRNNFHIFLSLTAKPENKPLNIYYALRLQSQKFILLKFHYPYMPWLGFLLHQFIDFED